VRLAALALVALAFATGCESNQERSASIGRRLERHNRALARQIEISQRALTVTHESAVVKVVSTTLLKGREGDAAVVTLHNLSARAYRDVPIEIEVKDARGASVYTNDTPGLAAGLNSEPLLPAHGTVAWVDDQVQPSGTPASVVAKVGEGVPVAGAPPSLGIAAAHRYVDPTNGPAVEGAVVNHSSVVQRELVVYALVRRSGAIVAAGRAVLPSVPADAPTRFQIFFVGGAAGGSLELLAPATTFG